MNRLHDASSLYLRQHADNPVAWQPWDAAALRQAADTDRPILLSIGYSACHWCHVMAHESFESDAIARVMNEAYVCIKVDREERPDLDKTYQLAHQLMTRQAGGWPLTVFLDPETLQPFFTGTYFPPDARHGLPGFPDVLRQLAVAFAEKRDAIRAQGESLRDWFARVEPRPGGDAPDPQLLTRALAQFEGQFDATHGGWGAAPKFPHPSTPGALLAHGNAVQREQAHATLLAMARGGLYDQIEGGFFRYSVDARWCIPHFEKMLYDNAQLLSLYARGWRDKPDSTYRRVIDGTIAWLDAGMHDDSGMYYASLDADNAHGEGDYYVYAESELEQTGGDDAHALKQTFGLDGPPNFEGRWHLLQPTEPQDTADRERRQHWIDALRRLRTTRDRPGRDDKLIAGWNALLASGLFEAAAACGEPGWTRRGIDILDAIRAHHWRDGHLHSVRYGEAVNPQAFSDDTAYTLQAALQRLQADWDAATLTWAVGLADALLERFSSPGGALYLSEADDLSPARQISLTDDALPCGNAVAARALADLTALTGITRYREAAERIVAAAGPALNAAPQAHVGILDALVHLRTDPPVAIVFDDDPAPWANLAASVYVIPPDCGPLPDGLEQRRAAAGTAYLCQGHRCLPPVQGRAALDAALGDQC